jgi:hypothetical protein
MRKPAKIALGTFGTIVAIIVIAGVANGGSATATAASTTTNPSTSATTPSATPAPTTSAAPVAPTADDLFVADVLDTHELVAVGRSICDSIGVPGVTRAGLVGELGTSKWGTAAAEVVVAAAEVNLCPERRYVVPTATLPSAAPPAPQPEPSPAPRPAPRPVPRAEPAPQPEPQPAPRAERQESPASAHYKNCAAARAAGAAPLHRGDAGYRAGLDRDDDGVACE